MTDKNLWFHIQSGEHEGRWHMRGWMKTAIRGVSTGPRDDGWLSLSVCPRCHAVVISDEEHPGGDNEWAHEQWHARTDHPLPSEPADTEGGTPARFSDFPIRTDESVKPGEIGLIVPHIEYRPQRGGSNA